MEGKLVNTAHPNVALWLKARKAAREPTEVKEPERKPQRGATAKPHQRVIVDDTDDGSSKYAGSLADLTIREISAKFGSEEDGDAPQIHFENWLKSLSLIEAIREKRLKNERSEGSLIEREIVAGALFSLIEEQNQRLLTDIPKTLARTIRAHAVSNTPLEQSEKEVRNVIGKTLDATKAKIIRRLERNF